MSTRGITLQRLDLARGVFREMEDEVAVDEAVCVFVNDEYYVTLMATPTMKEELVVGHLVGEGVIRSIRDVQRIEVEPLKVYVDLGEEVDLEFLRGRRVDLITTVCGLPTAFLREKQLEPLRVSSSIHMEAEEIWGKVHELNRSSSIFRKTGGTHSAMLSTVDGRTVAFAEDVGRHNAVDKVIGAAAISEVDMSRCMLASSGRQSSDIVLKAARGGIPIIASVAAPLELGITIAEAVGITLICFVRGRRMNVYTHPQRVSTGIRKRGKPDQDGPNNINSVRTDLITG